MRVTQGTFSFLPDLTDDEIASQVRYCLANGWPVSIEHTDDPHPRNVYWEMWGTPMFDLQDPAGVLAELAECRKAFPDRYIKISGYDRSYGRQTTALSFIVSRPLNEPGFRLDREESDDRRVRYSIHPYAADRPPGARYGNGNGSSQRHGSVSSP
jgi:ribulose-bisphosphate carboxylase small chain